MQVAGGGERGFSESAGFRRRREVVVPDGVRGEFWRRRVGVRLAQEIHDEFLVCKICLDSYKNPKCLACLHTFCEQCIDNHVNSESSYKKYSDYREFTCPLCRKRTHFLSAASRNCPTTFSSPASPRYT